MSVAVVVPVPIYVPIQMVGMTSAKTVRQLQVLVIPSQVTLAAPEDVNNGEDTMEGVGTLQTPLPYEWED